LNRYVRLFLRKTSAWHRINKLNYYSDISDLFSVAEDLQRKRSLPDSAPEDTFRFADGIEEITTLEEASSLLLLEELKVFAKDAKVQGKSKKELLAALRETSQTQKGLKDTNNRDSHFTQKILDYTGACIRISPVPRALFERVHLVFYRSTEWTEKSLTTIILAKMSKRKFPAYIVCRSSSIFASREALLEFESAIQTQFAIDNILEFNGPPTTASLQQIIDLANRFHPRWKELVEQEQMKEDSIYESGEGAYLRRFSPAWVLTRIIHKSLHPLGRFKEHKREHEVLEELLSQRLFHAARRGAWYQRKALLEEHYMWALSPADGRSEEARRKLWKQVALKTCETGLEDPLCHLIFHYDLQKRITKLEKALRIVKREQHDFGHVLLGKPVERTIEGIRIETGDSPRKGKATVWVDEREGGECRVESMCLSWYRDHGWKGFHSEGGIVRTLVSFNQYHSVLEYRADNLHDSSAISSTTSYSPMSPMSSKQHSKPAPSTCTQMSSIRPAHRR
jgi:Fanconi-associated nuclease 1